MGGDHSGRCRTIPQRGWTYARGCILRPVPSSAPRIQIDYQLSAQASPGLHNPLIALLAAVREAGSVAGAAQHLGYSYRHVWGELRRWEAELGHALVTWEKGRRARLSELGEKLLFAERLAQARAAPQIAALRAEIERAFALAFDPSAHVLTLHASHDDALPALRESAAARGLHLDIRFTGSVDAIRALNDGRCAIAGFHVIEGADDQSIASATYRPLLQPGRHKLIGFARRTQGLMLAPGNPLAIGTLTHLAARGLRFVNRAPGAGTRVVLDELLGRENLRPADLPGYAREEPSHAAVAQAVASGSADAGLGLASAALACGLAFVPMAHERFYLAVLKDALDQPASRRLREILQAPAWQAQLRTLAGYEPCDSGSVLSLHRELPWWRFTRAKSKRIRL